MKAIDFINKYNLSAISKRRDLDFCYFDYVIYCENYDLYDMIIRKAIKSHVYNGSHLYCKAVYVMDSVAIAPYESAEDKKIERANNWWIRYHNADEETRRLMSCGAIA